MHDLETIKKLNKKQVRRERKLLRKLAEKLKPKQADNDD